MFHKMETACVPDIYEPSNNKGIYVDMLQFTWPKAGLRCDCATRADKVYTTRTKFIAHIKTKGHRAWLNKLTENKANYYSKSRRLEVTNMNQQKIITRLSNDLENQVIINNALAHEIKSLKTPVEETMDLLLLD